MSRGGRGGRGGGYGGPPGARLNHGTMPFEISPELLEKSDKFAKDSGLFPHMDVPRPKPLTKRERQEAEAYVELRTKRQLGPYYLPSTAAERNARSKKGRSAKANDRATFNAFADQPTWYSGQQESRRQFKDDEFKKLPWQKELLPKELWGVTGLAIGTQYWPKAYTNSKSRLSMSQKLAKVDADNDGEGEIVKDPDEDERSEREDENAEEDDVIEEDDDFEDGEDDFAGDYNAEVYFENGEDDNDSVGGNDGGGGEEF